MHSKIVEFKRQNLGSMAEKHELFEKRAYNINYELVLYLCCGKLLKQINAISVMWSYFIDLFYRNI